MQTGHELFIHELADIFDGERRLVDALEKQAEACTNPQLKKAIESHQAQTEKQVQRLEQCFDQLGESPEQTECHGIMGLIQEHESFSKKILLKT